MDNPKLYSTKEAAQIIGKNIKTLERWRQSGKLVPVKVDENGYCYYSEQQLQTFPKLVKTTDKSTDIQTTDISQTTDILEKSTDILQTTDIETTDKTTDISIQTTDILDQTTDKVQTSTDKPQTFFQSTDIQTTDKVPTFSNKTTDILQTTDISSETTDINYRHFDSQTTDILSQTTDISEKNKAAQQEADTKNNEFINNSKKNDNKKSKKSQTNFDEIDSLKRRKNCDNYEAAIRRRKELAEQAKPLITNLLYELGVTDLRKNFHCINPAHNDSTPSMTYYADTHCVHCHGCGFHGNIFQVYSLVYNMPINKALFDEVFAKFNLIDTIGSNIKIKKRPKIAPVTSPANAKKELVDRSDDINLAYNKVNETDYWQCRGFNLKSVRHFRIGYISNWKHPDFSNTPPSDRLILPTGDCIHSYLARDVHNDGNFKVLKVGGSQLFHLEGFNSDYIIVNEGEFDAISTYQVGFHNVVGLGGVGNKHKFVNAIINMQTKPKFIIIALDNDKSGFDAANWIHQQLDKLQIYSVIINDVFGDNKDANNLLQCDSDALRSVYEKAIEKAQADYSTYQFPVEEIAENSDDDNDYDISEADLLYLTDDILEDLMYLPLTDAGNAERLIEAYGERIIFYLTDSGRWLNFNGCQWFKAADSANNSVTSMVTYMARQLRIFAKKREIEQKAIYDSFTTLPNGNIISIEALEGEAKEKAQDAWDNYNIAKATVSFSRRLEKRTDIDNSIYLAKGYGNIRITNNDLNTHKTLLNCPNGVVDLETGKLMQHDSSLLMTQCTNAYYIPNYHNELLEQTLHQIIPDEETLYQLLLFFAYGLTGLTDEEKAAFIRGGGGNGKSTITKLLMKALGNYAVTLPADVLLMASYFRDGNAPTPELAKLEFIRLAICDEIPPGRKMDIAKFKYLTGSDFLTARELHRDPRMIDPMFKLVLSGNHLPEIDDANDAAIKRRLIVYPFTQDFTQTGDPKLKNELMKQDPINGLLTFLVNYCIRYFKEGLGVSAAMQQARDEYLEDNDSIGQFIAENCEFDAEASIQRKDFIDRIRRSGTVTGMTDKTIIDALKKIDGIDYRRTLSGYKIFGIKWLNDNPTLDIIPPPDDSDIPY